MSTASGQRQNSSLKQKVPVGKSAVEPQAAREEEKMREIAAAGKFFTFTIDAATAQVVKFEALDAGGARHELSDDEKAALSRNGAGVGIEELVEQAFEAGIACVLGSGEGEEGAEESGEEVELRHLLLTPLIEHSPARRLLQREALTRAILGTLIQHATAAPVAAAGSSATELQAERAPPARAN
jgi:hypothetical protein